MRDPAFLLRPIVFHVPERAVHPPSWLDYTPFAFWIVDALRPATFVELGCHSGNSYASFAQAVQTLGLPTACYAVDTWRGDPHAGLIDEGVFEEWRGYHDRRFGRFSTLIRSSFDEARGQFTDGSIDLLHIDGYHTYDAVAHDFEVWRSAMSDRGVVLFHDINVRGQDFGVWRLWERLRGEHPSFEFLHGYGLGVLGLGRHLPDPVRWLFALAGEEAQTVRQFFAALGGAVAAHYAAADAQHALREARRQQAEVDTRPTVVVVSHVGAWRPRAGNEYRLNRMLRWYRAQGMRVVPIVAPLPGEELAAAAVDGMAAEFGNVIHVHRDGRTDHDLRDMPASFDARVLNGAPEGPFVVPGEDGASGRKGEPLKLERTFCHDAVISTVRRVQASLGPHILQVEYIWMSRLLPLVRTDVLKVIDTVDVFSSIDRKVRAFGLRDVTIEPQEEAQRLRRADLVIAIQEDERQELLRLVPGLPVVSAGVDFDVVADGAGSVAGRVLYVASGNSRNCKGLEDFLRLAWPRVRRRVPHAHLVVVGGVARALEHRRVADVTVLGGVDDVDARYREAALVINPVVAGTGVKIKTLEALSRLRPLVTWPAGVDGLDPNLAARCIVARDWYEFAQLAADVLSGERPAGFTAEDRAVIATLVSPDVTYRDLRQAYAEYLDRHRLVPRPLAAGTDAVDAVTVAHVD